MRKVREGHPALTGISSLRSDIPSACGGAGLATGEAHRCILVNIAKAVGASMQLRSKKELIESLVASVNTDTDIDAAWEEYVKQRKQDDLNEIIASENLKADETSKFVENAFRDGAIRTTGTDIDKILPAMSRFGGGNRQEKKKTVIEKLKAFFEKYFGVA